MKLPPRVAFARIIRTLSVNTRVADSSGNKRRQGGITKAGNSHLRRLLMEAAWHYRSYHPSSRTLVQRRQGADLQLISYANRAGGD